MSYFVDIRLLLIKMPEISSPFIIMSKNAEKHLAEITDGLKALEDAQITLAEVGFDRQTLHDLEQAIANGTLPHFVKFTEGKGELTEVLRAMREVRDLMSTMPQ
jgi:hypothetical protein